MDDKDVQGTEKEYTGTPAGRAFDAMAERVSRAINLDPRAGQPLSARSEITLENVEHVFQYQPWNAEQISAGQQVREALIAAAKVILRVVPAGPDRSVALRDVRNARMNANSAISFYGRF
mgnify:CR=1 FL=1